MKAGGIDTNRMSAHIERVYADVTRAAPNSIRALFDIERAFWG
jgi:hypothetical protein